MALNTDILRQLIEHMLAQPEKPLNLLELCVMTATSDESKILEIGPGDVPFYPKNVYPNVKLLDYYSREEMIHHFREDYKRDNVDAANFPEIDFVDKASDLAKAVGDERFDVVFSAHCIEHQPCLLKHLKQVEAILQDEHSAVVFFIPCRTATFDFLRDCSTTADVLQAYHLPPGRQLPRNVFDFYANAIKLNPNRKITANDPLEFSHSLQEAYQKFLCSLQEQPEYMDIHNWVFTPESASLLFLELYMLGLTSLFPKMVTATFKNHFVVVMTRIAPPSEEDLVYLNQVRMGYLKNNYSK